MASGSDCRFEQEQGDCQGLKDEDIDVMSEGHDGDDGVTISDQNQEEGEEEISYLNVDIDIDVLNDVDDDCDVGDVFETDPNILVLPTTTLTSMDTTVNGNDISLLDQDKDQKVKVKNNDDIAEVDLEENSDSSSDYSESEEEIDIDVEEISTEEDEEEVITEINTLSLTSNADLQLTNRYKNIIDLKKAEIFVHNPHFLLNSACVKNDCWKLSDSLILRVNNADADANEDKHESPVFKLHLTLEPGSLDPRFAQLMILIHEEVKPKFSTCYFKMCELQIDLHHPSPSSSSSNKSKSNSGITAMTGTGIVIETHSDKKNETQYNDKEVFASKRFVFKEDEANFGANAFDISTVIYKFCSKPDLRNLRQVKVKIANINEIKLNQELNLNPSSNEQEILLETTSKTTVGDSALQIEPPSANPGSSTLDSDSVPTPTTETSMKSKQGPEIQVISSDVEAEYEYVSARVTAKLQISVHTKTKTKIKARETKLPTIELDRIPVESKSMSPTKLKLFSNPNPNHDVLQNLTAPAETLHRVNLVFKNYDYDNNPEVDLIKFPKKIILKNMNHKNKNIKGRGQEGHGHQREEKLSPAATEAYTHFLGLSKNEGHLQVWFHWTPLVAMELLRFAFYTLKNQGIKEVTFMLNQTPDKNQVQNQGSGQIKDADCEVTYMKELMETCENVLVDHLICRFHLGTAIAIWNVANKYRRPDLESKALFAIIRSSQQLAVKIETESHDKSAEEIQVKIEADKKYQREVIENFLKENNLDPTHASLGILLPTSTSISKSDIESKTKETAKTN